MRTYPIRRIATTLLVLVVLGGCALFSGSASLVSQTPILTLYFIDVEQGNCVLIVSPSGTAALIDAGTGTSGNGKSDDDPVRFVRNLMAADIRFNLQYLLATHYDADHVGKLDDVLTAGLLAPNGTVFDRGAAQTEGTSVASGKCVT